jgi:hypothetical protein
VNAADYRNAQISLKKSLSHCRWDGGVIP